MPYPVAAVRGHQTPPGESAAFDPLTLFTTHAAGGIYIPTFGDLSKLFQDSAGTTPVTADNDPIGKVTDSGPTGVSVIQATAGSRPSLQTVSGRRVARFDGTADNWITDLIPPAVCTIIIAAEWNAVSDEATGANDTSNGNALGLGTDTGGKLAGRLDDQDQTIILGPSDIRDVPGVAAFKYQGNGLGWKLFWKPFGSAISTVDTGTQSGAPTVAIPLRLGARNGNGTATAFLDGDIYAVMIIAAYLTDQEVSDVATYFST